MDAATRAAFEGMLRDLLAAPAGQMVLDKARTALRAEAAARRFNTDRAVQVFGQVIERVVWDAHGGSSPLSSRSVARAGVPAAVARALAEECKQAEGGADQRPARGGLLGRLFGA